MKMKTQSNINTLENEQQESDIKIQVKASSSLESKHANNKQSQQSVLLSIDLKQILEAEQFIYSQWDDEKFPNIFIAMTPYMISKFGKYQRACHFQLWLGGIQSQCGLRDVGLLIALNSNLEPSVLVVLIFTNYQIKPHDAFFRLLKFVNDRCGIGNMVIYCNCPQLIQTSITNFNEQQKKKIKLQPSFIFKEQKIKEILLNYDIKKKPYFKKQALQLIQKILQEKDQKKFQKYINKFQQWNLLGYNKFINDQKQFKLIFELPQQFYSFYLYRKYSNIIQLWIKKLQKTKYKSELYLINQILQEQYKQMQIKRLPYIDECSVFEINSRVKQLQNIIEPNPLNQFVWNYQKSLSFKFNKINQKKYVIGGKIGTAYQVKRIGVNDWVCECGQTIRLGIPCEHLLKICCVEKLNFEDYIDPIYKIGHQKPFLRLD